MKLIAEVTLPARHPSPAVRGHQRACRAVPGPSRTLAATVGPSTHRARPSAAEQAPEPSPNTYEAQPGGRLPGARVFGFVGSESQEQGQPFYSFQLKWSQDHCCKIMAATRSPAPSHEEWGELGQVTDTSCFPGDQQRLRSVLGALRSPPPPAPLLSPRGPSSPDVSVCEKESVGAQFLFLQEPRMVLPIKIAQKARFLLKITKILSYVNHQASKKVKNFQRPQTNGL